MKVSCLAFLLLATPAFAADVPPVFTCDLARISDGDTIRVVCPDWPEPVRNQALRIAEIDSPESLRGVKGAKCDKELRLGLISKAWAKKQFAGQTKVTWQWRLDRGANGRDNSGRILANVTLPSGKDWGKEAVRVGMARFYDPDVSNSFQKPDYCH